jgi:hypothetical protein
VALAEITLTKQNIKNTVFTDQQGRFSIKLPDNGDYSIKIFKDKVNVYDSLIKIWNDTTKEIIISPKEKQIEVVTIHSKKKLIERKADRLIFNVENSVSLLGGDAIDALRLSPGVRVVDDNILLAGKGSVKIMVNDRILPISDSELFHYLKSIPAETINKIEIIHNPPANYDAEGNYGLINIVLKKTKSNSFKTNLRSTFQQATNGSLSHGIGISYKKNNISVLADLSYQYGKNKYTNDINFWYPTEHWINKIDNINHPKNMGNILNLNWDLNDKSSIGVQYLGSFSNNTTDENTLNKSYFNNSNLKEYLTEGTSNTNPQNISLNVNYNQKLDTLGKKFSIDADYFHTISNKNNSFNSLLKDFSNSSIENIYANNNSGRNIKNYSLKTDFELPFQFANISFGGKTSMSETDNNLLTNFYAINTGNIINSQNDSFNYRENMQALYWNADRSFGEKWEIKLGLRGENVQTNFLSYSTNQNYKNNYFKIFPTAYILYKLNDEHSFNLDFGKRIERPSYSALNPARWYLNPKSYTEGNPFLQPTFSYSYGFTYIYKEMLGVNLNYTVVKDDSAQLTFHDTQKETQLFKILNYTNGKNVTANVTFNYDIFPWWNTSVNLVAGYAEITPFVDILSTKYSGWSGYTTAYNTFTLNQSKTFFGSLYYEYVYPSVSNFSKQSSSSNTTIGLKYMMLDKKLTLGLSFEDVFRSDYTSSSNNSSNIEQTYKQYYDTRIVKLSVSYKFGNKKISLEKREIGNEEEKNRAN